MISFAIISPSGETLAWLLMALISSQGGSEAPRRVSSSEPPAQTQAVAITPPAAPDKAPVPDIFAVRSWMPPPPPESSAPPEPQTPPLPFRYIGRIDEAGKKPAILLTVGERVLPFSVGQMVNGQWRLTGDNGKQLTFRFLPLNTVQTLSIPAREAP